MSLRGRTFSLIITEGKSIGCGRSRNRVLAKTRRKLDQKLVPTSTGPWRARLDGVLWAWMRPSPNSKSRVGAGILQIKLQEVSREPVANKRGKRGKQMSQPYDLRSLVAK